MNASAIIAANISAHTVDGLTSDRLKQRLRYDAETGRFTRLSTGNNAFPVGGDVGNAQKSTGYMSTKVYGKPFSLHRLAWLYVYGCWPKGVIDHINGDKTDNRIANLRDVDVRTNSQNQRNPMPFNSTGRLGVCKHAKGYCARIVTTDGRQKFIGYFMDKEVAHAAYLKAKRELHAGNTL